MWYSFVIFSNLFNNNNVTKTFHTYLSIDLAASLIALVKILGAAHFSSCSAVVQGVISLVLTLLQFSIIDSTIPINATASEGECS